MEQQKQGFIFIIILALLAGFVGGTISGLQSPGSAPLAQGEDRATVNLVKQSLPGVVSITITRPSTTLFPQILVGGGSGFFVSADGVIVTNKHVVGDADAQFMVLTQDGKKYPAKVMATDPVLDLALMKVEGKDFPFLELGDSDQLAIGQSVIAIGNALAEFQNSVTKGIISGLHRRLVAGNNRNQTEVIEEAIQTDAAINPGNSGGPLINAAGRVIGVNTAISQDGQSLGFALPINAVKRAWESVQKNGRIVRPWIGVRYIQVDDDIATRSYLTYSYGALVLRGDQPGDLAVVPGSPAEKAGLKENDLILEINGQKLDVDHSLSSIISRAAPGDKVTLKIARDGKEMTLTVTLEERK